MTHSIKPLQSGYQMHISLFECVVFQIFCQFVFILTNIQFIHYYFLLNESFSLKYQKRYIVTGTSNHAFLTKVICVHL